MKIFLIFLFLQTLLFPFSISQSDNDVIRDKCSISSVHSTNAAQFDWPDITIPIRNQSSYNFDHGVVISIWSDFKSIRESQDGKLVIPSIYRCNIASQMQFAEMYGLKYFLFADSLQMLRERNYLSPGWAKLQAISYVLNVLNYPWVLYVDVDGLFYGLDSLPKDIPTTTRYLNRLNLTTYLNSEKFLNKSLFLPDGSRGWGTDFILIRNTEWSKAFIKHAFDLRHVCPHCVMEQCAIQLALFHSFIHHSNMLVSQNIDNLSDKIEISRAANQPCCYPANFCEYPNKDTSRHSGHSNNIQGCIWMWREGLNYVFEHRGGRHHPHISYTTDLRRTLSYWHPEKYRTKCPQDLALPTFHQL